MVDVVTQRPSSAPLHNDLRNWKSMKQNARTEAPINKWKWLETETLKKQYVSKFNYRASAMVASYHLMSSHSSSPSCSSMFWSGLLHDSFIQQRGSDWWCWHSPIVTWCWFPCTWRMIPLLLSNHLTACLYSVLCWPLHSLSHPCKIYCNHTFPPSLLLLLLPVTCSAVSQLTLLILSITAKIPFTLHSQNYSELYWQSEILGWLGFIIHERILNPTQNRASDEGYSIVVETWGSSPIQRFSSGLDSGYIYKFSSGLVLLPV